MKQLFIYLKPVIEGDDGKPSLRRFIAISFAITFIKVVTKMEPTVDMLWVVLAGVGGMLGLTTFQTVAGNKFAAQNKDIQEANTGS